MLRLNWNRRGWCSFRVAISQPVLRVCRDAIKRSVAVPAVMELLLVAVQVRAAEIEPRSYINTPVGINFLIAGYAYSQGGLATEGSSPLKDAQLKMHTGALAYARTLDVWGKSGKFDVILPYSHLSGSAMVAGQRRERKVYGVTRPALPFLGQFLWCSRIIAARICQLPTGFNHRGKRSGICATRPI